MKYENDSEPDFNEISIAKMSILLTIDTYWVISRFRVRKVCSCCNHQDGEDDKEKKRAEPVHGSGDVEDMKRFGHISSLEALIRCDELLK